MKKTLKSNLLVSIVSFGPKFLDLNDDTIMLHNKRFGLFSHEFTLPWPFRWLANILRGRKKLLNINKIIYFDSSLGLLGNKISTGYKAGGGDDSNVDFIINKNDLQILKNHIKDNGGSIGANDLIGKKIKTSFPFLSPSRWLSYREVITISDNGIGHTRKGWFKTRNSFLEFKSIKVFTYNGLIFKKICLLGDVTINPHESISESSFKKINKALKKHNVISNKGRNYKPALLSGKRGFTSSSFLVTEKGVFWKEKKKLGEAEIKFLSFKEIHSFHKEGWKKFFAPIVITGTRVDARKGEGGNITMVVPGIAFYRWNTLLFFSGSLKRSLKQNT